MSVGVGAGITYTDQYPADAIVTADLDDRTPTELWADLVASDDFKRAIIESIRSHARGKYTDEFREEVWELDLPPAFDEFAVGIAQGRQMSRIVFSIAVEKLGTGWTTLEDIRSVVGLLGLGDGEDNEDATTVAIRITSEFFDRRNDQRVAALGLVMELAESCDVRLVSSGIEQRKLATKHREDLPGVSEHCNTPRLDSPVSEVVETARAELRHDSREVRILRELADDATETLSYHALESLFQVSRSRVSQCISRLADLSLIDTFEGSNRKSAELLRTGSAFVDALDADIGRQAELDSCVSETGNSRFYCRVSTQPERGEGDGPRDRRRVGEAVDAEYLPRWRHAAVAGCATEGGITLVDHPQEKRDEQRQMFLSYDPDADRVVVSAEYTNPMQWWVCVARALTSYGMFDQVLTPDRLDGDIGNLAGLLTNDLRILRDGRCLGYLKDAHANGEDYAEALRGAEEELCKLTSGLSEVSGEEERQLRSVITKEALGLAGTVAHLCDLAGVDLVREARLPEFTRSFDEERRDALAETIARGAAIQSTLGHFAAYRQLFEDRPEKRSAAMSPDVDAADPHGRLIGSFVLVGNNVSSFEDQLSTKLRGPEEAHEDAPEFDVGVPVRSHVGRPAFAQAVREALAGKNLSPTREAISVMYALTGTPYDVAEALIRGLESDEKYPGRTIRVNECRIALRRGIDARRIIPDAAPSVSRITSALLTASVPVSKTDLAELADVSTRSVRTHLPTLETLGLVEETPGGYRLQLSFEDEQSSIVPEPLTASVMNHVDLLEQALPTVVGDAVYDADHPVGAAFWSDTPVDALLEAGPDLAPWIHIAVALAGPDADTDPEIVRFGQTPSQAPLPTEVAA